MRTIGRCRRAIGADAYGPTQLDSRCDGARVTAPALDDPGEATDVWAEALVAHEVRIEAAVRVTRVGQADSGGPVS